LNNIETCALDRGGKVWCWSVDEFGQLESTREPVRVAGLAGVRQLAAGGYHTCALLSTGAVSCWGDNILGQLGDGTTVDRETPAPVVGLTDAVQLTAGVWSTCARLRDATLRCWGSNQQWQVGDGTMVDHRETPVAVVGVSGVIQVETGGFTTCALMADRTVQCWGYNYNGELGDGTTVWARVAPSVVVGLTGVRELVGGDDHMCAVLLDATARCWGDNSRGALGNGSFVDSNVPVAVAGLRDVRSMSADLGHTCASLENGTAWCWGWNFYGQLGNPLLAVDQPYPTRVVGF
jgi:alpha-tubulin suppressor-like RCC1 family protein